MAAAAPPRDSRGTTEEARTVASLPGSAAYSLPPPPAALNLPADPAEWDARYLPALGYGYTFEPEDLHGIRGCVEEHGFAVACVAPVLPHPRLLPKHFTAGSGGA